jgi:NADPH-dependent glutamate synthase beta subunit-like oxidoreductase
MALFKDVKKPAIRTSTTGSEISPLRPRFSEKMAPCVGHCPNGVDIRAWLTTIAQAEAYGRTREQALEIAWFKIVDRNPFPAVCGRICPHPCEAGCNRKSKDGPVAINALERFIGDFGIERELKLNRIVENNEDKRPEKIAVIGSGPAGMSCAYQLSRRGYPVTIFEASGQPGGMFRYGVPRYRLPGKILDAEINRILDLGVELRCDCGVGNDISYERLRKEFKAVFLAEGAHQGIKLDVAGEDCADATVLYRRTEAEMPATALCQGRVAALTIDAHFRGEELARPTARPLSANMKLGWYKESARNERQPLSVELNNIDAEIESGFSETEALEEAKRCMSCGMCMDCETCWMYCTSNCFIRLPKGEHYKIKLEGCNGCKKCAEACPCGYIDLD